MIQVITGNEQIIKKMIRKTQTKQMHLQADQQYNKTMFEYPMQIDISSVQIDINTRFKIKHERNS